MIRKDAEEDKVMTVKILGLEGRRRWDWKRKGGVLPLLFFF